MSGGANNLPVFKPQWAYPTPPGFRDEFFAVPFNWTIPGDGSFVRSLPWALDDDVPYIIRGILFSEIGTYRGSIFPGFCRIWEPHGNPLSSRGSVAQDGPEYLDLALANGVWSQSGFNEINGFGFPIEPEIYCPAGSTLLHDFQLNTNAGFGDLDVLGPGADFLEVVAGLMGSIGGTFSLTLIDPGAPNVPLSVALVGLDLQVTLATDGGSALISTFNDVVAAINAAGAAGLIPAPAPWGAFPIMRAFLGGTGDGTTIVPANPQTFLTNGAGPSSPMYISGCYIGVKRFQECL